MNMETLEGIVKKALVKRSEELLGHLGATLLSDKNASVILIHERELMLDLLRDDAKRSVLLKNLLAEFK